MITESQNRIIGAVIGDIVGSTFEFTDKIPGRFKLFRSACTFTDDTVLTAAIADALLHGRDFADAIYDWGNRYIYAGFGRSFRNWKKRRKQDPAATNDSKVTEAECVPALWDSLHVPLTMLWNLQKRLQ